jgi:drug/metabolite transporter (DMT)-like permease
VSWLAGSLAAIGGALFFSELYGFLIRPPRLREDAIGLAALGLAMFSAGIALWAGGPPFPANTKERNETHESHR